MIRSAFLACVCVLVTVSAAHGSPVTFSYEGIVDSVGGFDPSFINDPAGATFSGTYTFDDNAPDGVAGGANGAFVGDALTLALAGSSFSFTPVSILTTNIPGLDQYLVGYSDFSTTSLSIRLEDTQGTALATDALPITPPSLTPFDVRFFFFQVLDADGNLLVDVNGTIQSLECTAGCEATPAPVPEPATLLLLGSGLAAAAVRRRRIGRT